eukprot:2746522-Pyramimonas_sp.AAC.1
MRPFHPVQRFVARKGAPPPKASVATFEFVRSTQYSVLWSGGDVRMRPAQCSASWPCGELRWKFQWRRAHASTPP